MSELVETKKTIKVLVIGARNISGVTCVTWEKANSMLIPDFDVCVLNTRSLDDSFLKKSKSDEILKAVRTGLARLLRSRGKVIAIGDVFRNVPRNGYPESLNNYDWTPFEIRFGTEKGDSIVVRDQAYPAYFKKHKNWEFWYLLDIGQTAKDYLGQHDRYQFAHSVIRTNREKRTLAANHQFQVFRGVKKQGTYDSRSYWETPNSPDELWGDFVFLPPIPDATSDESVADVLSDLGISTYTHAPEWAATVGIPGTSDLESKLIGVNEKIRQLEEDKKTIEESLNNLNRFRGLLFESGHELENIFGDAMRKLGAAIQKTPGANEEYILQLGELEVVVEVKGNSKSISRTDLRQLLDHVLNYEDRKKKSGKGLLFGNAWRSIPPEERASKDKPIFPPDVIEMAAKHGLALLSSIDFLKAFSDYLSGSVSADDIVNAIVVANGQVNFPKKT